MSDEFRVRQVKGKEIEFDDRGEVRVSKTCGRCDRDLMIPIDDLDLIRESGGYGGFCFDKGIFYHRECYESACEDEGVGKLACV